MLINYLNEHPLLFGFLISILMILDLELTRVGQRKSKQGHRDYFVTELYEMNPRYQEVITKDNVPIKSYLFRIILGLFFGVAYSFLIASLTDEDLWLIIFLDFFSGFIIILFVTLNAIHLQNILIFNYIINNPSTLDGRLNINYRYSFATTRIIWLIFGVIWLFNAILTGEAFIWGGTLSVILQNRNINKFEEKHEEKIMEKQNEDRIDDMRAIEEDKIEDVSFYLITKLVLYIQE